MALERDDVCFFHRPYAGVAEARTLNDVGRFSSCSTPTRAGATVWSSSDVSACLTPSATSGLGRSSPRSAVRASCRRAWACAPTRRRRAACGSSRRREIHDLIAELPAELHPALERGELESRAATPMSADEFLAWVAERGRVSRDEAERLVGAVFAGLHDVISLKEFADLAAQLSRDYEPVLAAST